jgi:hypothetical protein
VTEQKGAFTGNIQDAATGAGIPAKVKVTDRSGRIWPVAMLEGWIRSMWGEGEFELDLAAGACQVARSRGHEYPDHP